MSMAIASASKTQLPVLIIGGGLGGLSLAQGLLKYRHQYPLHTPVPFRIFERDPAANVRTQGYRIRISEDGGNALKTLLSDDLWRLFEASCAEVVNGGHQLDARTGTKVVVEKKTPVLRGKQSGPPPVFGKAWNADRAVLRNVLLKGLEEHISYGKKLDNYELQEDESVLAHFSDGTVERGSIIIGADGVRSAVRRQMLPDHVVLDTEGRGVFGKTTITEPLREKIATEIGQGLIMIGDPDDDTEEGRTPMKLFCDMMRFNRDSDLPVKLPEDYLYWVLSFQKARTGLEDSKLWALSNQQSAELAINLTKSWHEKCANIVRNQETDAASTLSFVTSRPEMDGWEASSLITLLGDAAHPMPPVGGVGANAAFQDAALLVELLRTGQWSTKDVGNYEESVRSRVRKSIEQSTIGAGRFFGMRPVEELKPANLWS